MLWELVFMMLILKIPVFYLCVVVWWAIKAEPRPLEGAPLPAPLGPEPGCDWRGRRARGLRPLPGGGGSGRFSGAHSVARARALARARDAS